MDTQKDFNLIKNISIPMYYVQTLNKQYYIFCKQHSSEFL